MQFSKRRRDLSVAAWTMAGLAAMLVAGCGGGSTAGVPLSGTAATGAPMAGAAITVTCADGVVFNTTTSATGSWSANISSSSELPCLVKAVGGTPPVTLHSVATTSGTVNVTPLTNLVVAGAAGSDPAAWFSANSSKLSTALPALAAKVPAAQTALVTSLKSAGYTVPGDILTTAFTPKDGDPIDDLLEAVVKGAKDAGITYDDLVKKVASAGTTPISVPKTDVITAAQVAAQARLNGGKVTVANGVASMVTTTDTNPVGAFFGGGNGNKSVLQIPGLAGLKVKDLKSIELELKPISKMGTDGPQGTWPYVYINIMVDLDCGATTLPANATALDARKKRRILIYDPFYKFIQDNPTAISTTDYTTLTITPSTGGWRVSAGETLDPTGQGDAGTEEAVQGSQFSLTAPTAFKYPEACIVDAVPSADGGLYRDTSKPECVSTSGLATTAPASCGKPHAGFLLNLGDSNTKTDANWLVRKVKVNDRTFTFE